MNLEVAGAGSADGKTTGFLLHNDFMVLVNLVCLDFEVNDHFIGKLGCLEDDFSKGLCTLNAEGGGNLGVEFEVGGSLEGLPVVDGREGVLVATVLTMFSVVSMVWSHAMSASRDTSGSWSMHEEVEDEESTEEGNGELDEAKEDIGTLAADGDWHRRREFLLQHQRSFLVVIRCGRHGCCR